MWAARRSDDIGLRLWDIGFGLVAVVDEALDVEDVAQDAATRGPLDRDDEVDSFADHFTHRLLARFGSELLESAQGRLGGVGVDRGDATGMPRVPGLQQSKRGAVANLAGGD